MGVKGLWTLLNPVARPIKIETLEGKRLAIDSSIWLYQFQATMKDKEGRTLVNAHVLGFLRRINKLLFHGIKPVFVFDGGAPALKRSTINERKRRKTGNATNHAQTAEKILNLQLRQAALKQAQAKRSLKRTTSGRSIVSNDENGQGIEDVEDEDDTGDLITEDMVFLNDLSAPPIVHRASSSNSVVQPTGQPNAEAGPSRSRSRSFTKSASRSVSPKKRSVSPLKRAGESEAAPTGKKKFVRVDPYELPKLANQSMHPSGAGGGQSDERLATEEELREFIDEMKASDLDVSSAEFLALPPEVQYEITNDLRLRSRAPNYRRTALMVQSSATALDFSKAQIAGLKVRNNLTQRMWGLAGVEGGLVAEGGRIAGEKGREYCLIKNEKEGGWSLGIRNEGTSDKPIDIAEEDEDEDRIGGEGRPRKRRRMIRGGVLVEELSGDDSEEEFHRPEPTKPIDPDWLEQKRKSALDALAARYSPVKKPTKVVRQPQVFAAPRAADAPPLFEIESSSAEGSENEVVLVADRLSEDEDADLQQALEQSARDIPTTRSTAVAPPMSSDPDGDADLEAAIALSRRAAPVSDDSSEDSDMEEVAPITTLVVRPAAPAAIEIASSSVDGESGGEMEEIHLPTPPRHRPGTVLSTLPKDPSRELSGLSEVIALESDDEELTAGPTPTGKGPAKRPSPRSPSPLSISQTFPESASSPAARAFATSSHKAVPIARPKSMSAPQRVLGHSSNGSPTVVMQRPAASLMPLAEQTVQTTLQAITRPPAPSFDILAPVSQPVARSPPTASADRPAAGRLPSVSLAAALPPAVDSVALSPDVSKSNSPPLLIESDLRPPTVSSLEEPGLPPISGAQLTQEARTLQRHSSPLAPPIPLGSDESDMEWSPSPPPMQAYRAEDDQQPPTDAEFDDQTADEGALDESADQDDYARFLAQVKGKDLQQVQDELSAELKTLNQQRKKQTGEGDENITQQMVAQVQMLLQSFGIPYITAPMEAEAQCAELANLRLVDGIITDDSDVFLFGGQKCYKNLFNDSKYVECYLATDILRELSLTRDRLVTMAFLLGSDYATGLPGVGYVTAMEIMAEFPGDGDEGLVDFRTWWLKVQSGRDTDADTDTRWKKAFKKKNKANIHLDPSFPNPKVRPAYFTPEVDSSDEPFTWGFPDLERLRRLLSGELGWSISKVDDEVLPIVHRIARRSNGIFANTTQQGSLDSFFDTSGGGTAVFAPKVRQTNPSKRLQAVVQRFRETVAARAGEQAPAKPLFFANDDSSDSGSASDDSDVQIAKPPKKRAKGKTTPASRDGRGGKAVRGSTRGRTRGRGGARSSAATSTHSTDANDAIDDAPPPSPPPRRKRAPARRKVARATMPEPESDDGQAAFGEDVEAAPIAPARPRPKPKPRTSRATTSGSGDDDANNAGSDDDYVGA